jgi:hypothetical protein
LQPVETGHQDVEHDEIRLLHGFIEGGQGADSVLGRLDVVPLELKCATHGPPQGRVIVDHEDSRHN